MKKHLFIVNPSAGRQNSSELIRNIEAAALGENFEVVQTSHKGHATEIVAARAASGDEIRVYSCGGDGTLNEVVNGAAGHPNVAVTMYPCGTGNDFVRTFGEHAPRFLSFEELMRGDEAVFDLIECGGRYSINICSVGFDAQCAHDVAKYKRLPLITPYMAFSLSAAVNVIGGMGKRYAVMLDGERFDGDYTMFTACNCRFYGGGYNPVPEADPTDGLIEFLLVKKIHRYQVPSLISKYSAGRYRELTDVCLHVSGRCLDIECLDGMATANADGETFRVPSLRINISDSKLRVFGPHGCFDEWKRA